MNEGTRRCWWRPDTTQITLLVAALTLGAPAPKEPKTHPIVGTWQILTGTQEGKSHEVKGDHCWTFTADGRRGSHTLTTESTSWSKYELNEKTRPGSLDVIFEPGGGAMIERFLFEVDGDMLKLCTHPQGRPETISAEKGSQNIIYTLKRVPAKK